jgi:hypothetical protein
VVDKGEMTTSEPQTVVAAADKTADTNSDVITSEQCSACKHAWDKHDALGVRYCTATTAGSLSRGCICR